MPETHLTTLTQDSQTYHGWVQLHYMSWTDPMVSMGSALPVDLCPPVEQLKAGTVVELTYSEPQVLGSIRVTEYKTDFEEETDAL